MLEFTRELMSAINNRQPAALAIVIAADGALPARPGFKLLMRVDGSWLGNVGGGELEARIRQDTHNTLLTMSKPHTFRYTLREEGPDAIGPLCGQCRFDYVPGHDHFQRN